MLQSRDIYLHNWTLNSASQIQRNLLIRPHSSRIYAQQLKKAIYATYT